jgi:hypothetical protein
MTTNAFAHPNTTKIHCLTFPHKDVWKNPGRKGKLSVSPLRKRCWSHRFLPRLRIDDDVVRFVGKRWRTQKERNSSCTGLGRGKGCLYTTRKSGSHFLAYLESRRTWTTKLSIPFRANGKIVPLTTYKSSSHSDIYLLRHHSKNKRNGIADPQDVRLYTTHSQQGQTGAFRSPFL